MDGLSAATGPAANGAASASWPAQEWPDGHDLSLTVPVVEQARGVVMGRFGMETGAAIALLREWSSSTGIRLCDLGSILVHAAGQNPSRAGQEPPDGPGLDAVFDWLTAGTDPVPPPHGAAVDKAPDVKLTAELMDAMAEVIVNAQGPAGRAAAVAAFVGELQALVHWCTPSDTDDESAGIGAIATVTETHLLAMQAHPARCR